MMNDINKNLINIIQKISGLNEFEIKSNWQKCLFLPPFNLSYVDLLYMYYLVETVYSVDICEDLLGRGDFLNLSLIEASIAKSLRRMYEI